MLIGKIDFGGNLILAPMEGVSDIGFRDVCSYFGADATYSEMLSARAMHHNPKKTALMTIYSPRERIKIGQIFGHEPEIMAEAINNPLLSHYDIIDINMGCQEKKIVKNGEGSALLKDLPLASKIISTCVKASSRPVSVKIRLGWSSDNSLEIGRMCEESGASFITLHSRTTEQGYSGQADYEAIARLKSALKIPVIGNGDVCDKISYENILKTGVDGVMIGRASQGKPYIFSQLKNLDYNDDLMPILHRHIKLLREHYDEEFITKYMRKHLLWYASFLKGEDRIKVATSLAIDKSLEIIECALCEKAQK